MFDKDHIVFTSPYNCTYILISYLFLPQNTSRQITTSRFYYLFILIKDGEVQYGFRIM